MKATPTWSDQIPDRDDKRSTVWDVTFNPAGTHLVAAVGMRVLLYDAEGGDLIKNLRGHKDVVYTVDYASDGKFFASGGADCIVIIWTSAGEGMLKYSHNDSIQCVKYNPITQVLASCTGNDFGLWSPEQKAVNKIKVGSRILACDWSPDGQYLALGLYDGKISIRSKEGEEKMVINELSSPVWTLAWNPIYTDATDATLAVGCWDKTLSFFRLNGKQASRQRKLDFDPCGISFFNKGEYLIVTGSNKEVWLYSKEGIKLEKICSLGDWGWAAMARPGHSEVAVASNDREISMHRMTFSTVHALYQDRYAYRDSMTDIVVQHMISEQKVRIKCGDCVQKIAIFKNRIAVQLPEKVIVYELSDSSDSFDMQYRSKDKIHQTIDCTFMAVTSYHLVVCLDSKLQLYNFKGQKEKEWVLSSPVKYVKVTGGPPGCEGLLIGQKDGGVLRIFVDNPFPIELIKHSSAIRCLDLSKSRRKLAVVDEHSTCKVYDLVTQESVFEEENANSVAWNTEYEDMLCFAGNNVLSIKTGSFPVHQQQMSGFVVGFNGSKVFCLNSVAMQTIDVPQSASVYRYLGIRDYASAYKVACLGVTETDWRLLAMSALQGLEFEIARKSFIRIRDMKYIELLNSIEQERSMLQSTAHRNKKQQEQKQDSKPRRSRRRGPNSENSQADSNLNITDIATPRGEDDIKKDEAEVNQLHLAEILAYQQRYQEAAKVFTKCGEVGRAVDMFSDLRQWEEAKTFAKNSDSVDVKGLIQKQAEWAEETNDWKAAMEMYAAAGNYEKAVEIVGEHEWYDDLIEIARTVDKSNLSVLRHCANYFRRGNHHQYAKEVYLKMDDIDSLMKLHVDLRKWEDAFILAQQRGEGKYAQSVYIPYANWLAENDRFEEAQHAYKQAGRPAESIRMLEQFANSAIEEQRYDGAATYLWLISEERLNMVTTDVMTEQLSPIDCANIKDFEKYRKLAQQYYSYQVVSKVKDEPFPSLEPESVFNAARYLLNVMGPQSPFGISRSVVLLALAKQAKEVGAYKLARFSLGKLDQLCMSKQMASEVDHEAMLIQVKPYSDREELLDVCYRCSATNPLVNSSFVGDECVQCAHPFIRSFKSFDALPLVEFRPEDSIDDEQAEEFLKSEPGGKQKSKLGHSSVDDEGKDDRVESDGPWRSSIGERDNFNAIGDDSGTDMFAKYMLKYDFNQPGNKYEPMVVPKEVLKSTSFSDVFIVKHKCPGRRAKFFKNVIPDVRVEQCKQCNNFFHEEDLETAMLSNNNQCPFCKSHSPIQQA